MKISNYIFGVLASMAILPMLSGCGGLTVNDATVSDLTWLKGQWKGKMGDSTMTEKWVQMNDQLLRGAGFVVEEGDTVGIREMTITRADTRLVLNLRVSRNQQPLGYQLVKINGQKLTFENEEAENPTRIMYEQKNGSLNVRWEGEANSKSYSLEKQEEVEN